MTSPVSHLSRSETAIAMSRDMALSGQKGEIKYKCLTAPPQKKQHNFD